MMSAVKRKPVTKEVELVEIPGTGIKMERLLGPRHPLVPPVDSVFHFRKEMVEEIAYCVKAGVNTMITGDTGAGKSTTVRQLAAFLNRPLRNVNLHGESDTTIFVGRDHPTTINGERTMEYRPGVLAQAMAEGHWFLADEWDAALQPILFVMQSVLEEDSKLVLEDNEGTVVRPAHGWHMFATANSVGIAGKNKLLYAGTNRTNEATLDRFGAVLYVTYMEPREEIEVIGGKVPDLDSDFVRAIVEIANEVRHQLKDEQLSCTFSTRRCIDWARAMTHFSPMRAARLSVLNKLNSDDYKAIEGVIQRFFGSK